MATCDERGNGSFPRIPSILSDFRFHCLIPPDLDQISLNGHLCRPVTVTTIAEICEATHGAAGDENSETLYLDSS